MKELSIEEKAKLYDKALRVVEKLHSSWKETQNRAADEIEEAFPELRVSEDERIRKELIEFFNQFENGELRGVDITPWIAWLEKQGEEKPIKEHNICTFCEDKYGYVSPCPTKLIEEQKPADKVEPKFKVGDSIKTANEEPLTITEITDNGYWSEDLFICNFDDAAKWELVEQEPVDKFEPKFNVGDWLVCCNYEPEQIIGIRNDMYEMSNGDIRPIKMITNNHNIRLWTIQDAKDGDVLANNGNIILFKEISNSARQDYKYIKSHCLVLAHSLDFYTGGSYNLDDGFHPTTQEQRDLLFTKMKDAGYEWDVKDKVLKKIEQKPDWGEEDEVMINSIIKNLDEGDWFDIYQVDWLKSLKDRIILTNKNDFDRGYEVGVSAAKFNQWKPTEEQMKSMARATNRCISVGDVKVLLSLYNDLKKLQNQ